MTITIRKRIFVYRMITNDEKKFITWWETNRDKEKRVFRQWLVGLPAALLVGIAIAVNFSAGWYKRAAYIANSSFNPLVLVLAILVIITFIAIFSKKHTWDMNEQRYKELKSKSDSDNIP